MESRPYYIEYQIPFCAPFVCSVEYPGNSSHVVIWECMPSHCRQRIEGFIALLSMLAVLTTVFNSVILAANLSPRTRRLRRRNPTMQNYSTYVISMAIADLLVGAIVLPLAVGHFYMEAATERTLTLEAGDENSTSLTYHATITVEEIIERNTSANLADFTWLPEQDTQYLTSYTTEEPKGLNAIKNCLGVFAHIVIFVSVYTLAAASADRFYTSTKPISSRPIKLSSSSFRRSHKNASPDSTQPLFNISRSTFAVVIIWLAGLLFGFAPLGVSRDFHFRSVGHVYVALSSNGNYTASLTWYGVALALPLVVTWVFSFLICVTLWRRKRRLKHSSATRNYSTKTLNRQPSDRDQEISVRQTSRVSVTVSHGTGSVVERILSNDTDEGMVVPDDQPYSVVFDENNPNNEGNSSAPPPYRGLQKRRRSSVDLGISLRRQNSSETAEALRSKHRRIGSQGDSARYSDGDCLKTQAGFVAMRILYRKSWNGCSEEGSSFPQSPDRVRRVLPVTPFPRSSGSISSISNSKINSPKTPTRERRCDAGRSATSSTRVRRKSSVFRARELLMSKSLETNIAKTLCAVVLACTVAVLPLLITVTTLSRKENAPKEVLNAEVSAIIVSLTILFSNCLWNSIIYGSRMPYFRSTVIRKIRRLMSRVKRSKGGQLLSTFFGSVRRGVSGTSFRSTGSAGPAVDSRIESVEPEL